MITYVNNVFVSNVGTIAANLSNVGKGQFFFLDVDTNAAVTAATTRFKIGMGTGKQIPYLTRAANGTVSSATLKEVKWSNIINVADIKGWADHQHAGDTPDIVTIDFTGATGLIGSGKLLSTAGKRIIVRLTFKDLPTRYRKWTESYEYITKDGDTAATIASNIANMINLKEAKRARVIADGTTTSGNLVLTAMTYDDDNTVDSLNWYNKVRFNANVYYTDPAAEGWESLNKHFPTGTTITKVPRKTDPTSSKLVRDREAQAMGYDGILNRGEGTWPIIKPEMNTVLSNSYNSVTIEFENTYRTADDLFRKTKQAIEIYTTGNTSVITNVLDLLVGDVVDKTIDKD